MNWKNYEETVKHIYEIKGESSGVKIECYGAKCKRQGKSGVSHQIDVLASHTDGIHTYYTAIECKYLNEKVNKDAIIKVAHIIEDCGIDKGVIVTKIGFTPDAIGSAKYRNIELIELKEVVYETNDSRAVKKFFLHWEITQAKLEGINLIVNESLIDEYKLNSSLLNTQNCYYEFKDGTKKNNADIVQTFLNEKVLNSSLQEIVEEKINFPDETYVKLNTDDYSFPILGLTIRGFLIKYTALDVDWLEDKVWLIMKVVFNEKKFVITLNGEIEEFKTNRFQMTVNEKVYFTLKPRIREYIIKK